MRIYICKLIFYPSFLALNHYFEEYHSYPVDSQCLETVWLRASSLNISLLTRGMIIYICMVMPVRRTRRRWMLLIATRCWWGLTKSLSRITMVTTNHRQHGVLYCHRWNKGNTILIRQIIGYITILCWWFLIPFWTHFKLKEISSRNAIYPCCSNIKWFNVKKT